MSALRYLVTLILGVVNFSFKMSFMFFKFLLLIWFDILAVHGTLKSLF